VFDYLLVNRKSIESDVGTELSWEAPENKRMRRVVFYRPGESDVSMTESYQEFTDFFLNGAIRLRDALATHLDAAAQEIEEEE